MVAAARRGTESGKGESRVDRGKMVRYAVSVSMGKAFGARELD